MNEKTVKLIDAAEKILALWKNTLENQEGFAPPPKDEAIRVHGALELALKEIKE